MTPKILAAAIAGLMVSGAAQALLIDDFTVNQQVAAFASTDSNSVAAGLGTSRTLTAENTEGQTQAFINTLVPSVLDMSNTTTATGTVTVDWTGIASLDFTDGGLATGLFLAIPNPIDNALDVTFTVNGSSAVAVSFPNGASGNDFFIPFASFGDPSQFDSVTTLTVSFTGPTAWDAGVDFIETRPNPAPLPGTLLLMGAGLIGLGVRRARQS
jgi:hypothetical protein